MLNDIQVNAVIALTPVQALIAWDDLHRSDPSFPAPPIPDAQELLGAVSLTAMYQELPSGGRFLRELREHHKDHADVVVPLCRRTHPEAVGALETLIGHPITRLNPRGKARPPRDPRIGAGMINPDGTPRQPRQRSASVASTDTRTILEVIPNPKRPGTASWERYNKYEVGKKVHEVIAAGLTPGDIKWDLDRGFIRLGA